ncbi:uncharacterized protein G2W53_027387 [Senna tora]|uniref:Uncharacterized protein n=1 Tax=Senna tora TaxID=362788 RepID=A0A834WGK4_9FABA|nr:uncharacterized protein G2W53_027387 [Senna tora]
MVPIFKELNPIQHAPTVNEIEEVWKEIYDAQEELTTNERNFEKANQVELEPIITLSLKRA